MKQEDKTAGTFILKFAFRLVFAFLSVSAFFSFSGPFYSRLFLPFIPSTIRLIYPEYRVEAAQFNGKKMRIECRITILGDVLDEEGISRQAEIHIENHIPVNILYISPILLFSLQLAWPNLRKRGRLAAFLAGLPFLFLMALIDIPLTMINQMEHRLVVESVGHKLRQFLIYFFNNGGRQFGALILGLATIYMLRLKDVFAIKQAPHRNVPCPCGSGKKFKKCCM